MTLVSDKLLLEHSNAIFSTPAIGTNLPQFCQVGRHTDWVPMITTRAMDAEAQALQQ